MTDKPTSPSIRAADRIFVTTKVSEDENRYSWAIIIEEETHCNELVEAIEFLLKPYSDSEIESTWELCEAKRLLSKTRRGE